MKAQSPRRSRSSLNLETASVLQIRISDALASNPVNIFMTVVILINACQVLYECDISSACRYRNDQAACDQETGWLKLMNWVYLVIYSIELGFRIYVHRIRCFTNGWDMFDATVIFVGLSSEALGGLLPSTGILRLARLARLSRAFRVVKLPHELHVMIHGLQAAMSAIAFGALAVFGLLTLWAIVAVEILNELNQEASLLAIYEAEECSRCHRAWSSISESVWSFTQLTIMGENWDVLAIPMVEKYPFTLLLYGGVFFTVVMGMSNLILAVIVEKALSAHDDNLKREAAEMEKKNAHAFEQFVDICVGMDLDGDGTLDIKEMKMGFENSLEFREILKMMDITESELDVLFHLMDADASGTVSYEEFGRELASVKNACLQTTVSFTKYHVLQIRMMLEQLAATLMSQDKFRQLIDKSSVNSHGMHFERSQEDIDQEAEEFGVSGQSDKGRSSAHEDKGAGMTNEEVRTVAPADVAQLWMRLQEGSRQETPTDATADAARLLKQLQQNIDHQETLTIATVDAANSEKSAAIQTGSTPSATCKNTEVAKKDVLDISWRENGLDEWLRSLDQRAEKMNREAVSSATHCAALVADVRAIIFKLNLADQKNAGSGAQHGRKSPEHICNGTPSAVGVEAECGTANTIMMPSCASQERLSTNRIKAAGAPHLELCEL